MRHCLPLLPLLGVLACFSSPVAAQPTSIRFIVRDYQTRELIPCRIHFKDASGQPVRAPGLPFWRDHFVCPGEAAIILSPGDYTYEIERGPEYRPAGGKVTAAPGSADVSVDLLRLATLAREGWWSGDLHVHRPVKDIELLMRAEDLHVAPVITWWNKQNPWRTETPPRVPLVLFDGNRAYDVMAGEDEREGGALLFFHLNGPLPVAGASREYPSPMTFLAQARQQAGAWVDVEKPFWWDAPVWVASGQIDSIGLANNHMCRSQMYESEAWGNARDTERLPAPRGNGFWTQEIYYHLLNCGLRLPPSAGSASGVLPNPVGYNRVYVHLGRTFSHAAWWEGLRAGRSFVSNGPLLRCRANGKLPGHIFRAPASRDLTVKLDVALDSNDAIPFIEVIVNGRVERQVPYAEWKRTGSLGELRFREPGWFLVRAVADNAKTFRFASTAPFYVEHGGATARISRASAQFFVDWVRERMTRVKHDDAAQREEILRHHRAAERFWLEKVNAANAE
ncbi:MAG: CehA/McbA family metallohydrolase [Verrucomicrobiota bacterium]